MFIYPGWVLLGGSNEEEELSEKEEEHPVEEIGGLCLMWPCLVWNGSEEWLVCCDFHCLDLVEFSIMLILLMLHSPHRQECSDKILTAVFDGLQLCQINKLD